jgi:hypothetical protein
MYLLVMFLVSPVWQGKRQIKKDVWYHLTILLRNTKIQQSDGSALDNWVKNTG